VCSPGACLVRCCSRFSSAAGLTAATGLFDSAAALFTVLGLSVVAGLGAVGVASLYAALGTPLESS
jgi:hypothetical protein